MAKTPQEAIASVRRRATKWVRMGLHLGAPITIQLEPARAGQAGRRLSGTIDRYEFFRARCAGKSYVAQFKVWVKNPVGLVFGPYIVEKLPCP